MNQTRTSDTHPLQIADIQTPYDGRVGVTLCPGKVDPHAMTGAWNRDLPTDLRAIQAWGAETLVTLVEKHELEALKVPEIGDQCLSIGLHWLHLPIRDVSIPSQNFEILWGKESPALISTMREGGNVVVHCKGGLGRAGLVAARLLIEMGVAPDEAIQRVRVARPGAIETRQQERYLLDQAWLDQP